MRAPIEEGSVLYFSESSFNTLEPHYFVVLNPNPLSDPTIAMVCATTSRKVYKRRRDQHPDTLVVVPAGECVLLKLESIFDCNKVIEKPLQVVLDKIKTGSIKSKGLIEKPILRKIKLGVRKSGLVKLWIQRIVLI